MGDWLCSCCNNVNFVFRKVCNLCGQPKQQQSSCDINVTKENTSHNNGNNRNTNSTTSATTKTAPNSTAINTTTNSTVVSTSINKSINVDNLTFNQSKRKQNFETIEVMKRRKTTIEQREQTKHPKSIKKVLKKGINKKGQPIFFVELYDGEQRWVTEYHVKNIESEYVNCDITTTPHTTSIMLKPIDTTNPGSSNIHNSNKNKN